MTLRYIPSQEVSAMVSVHYYVDHFRWMEVDDAPLRPNGMHHFYTGNEI